MPDKTENLQSKRGKDTRRGELAIVMAQQLPPRWLWPTAHNGILP